MNNIPRFCDFVTSSTFDAVLRYLPIFFAVLRYLSIFSAVLRCSAPPNVPLNNHYVVCLPRQVICSSVFLGKLEFKLFALISFIRLVWQFTCFIRLAGQITIQSVYLGVMKEYCLPLDSSLKRLLPSGILPHILKFTPDMTNYWVTDGFSKMLSIASRDDKCSR